jgi:hypothetical protein
VCEGARLENSKHDNIVSSEYSKLSCNFKSFESTLLTKRREDSFSAWPFKRSDADNNDWKNFNRGETVQPSRDVRYRANFTNARDRVSSTVGLLGRTSERARERESERECWGGEGRGGRSGIEGERSTRRSGRVVGRRAGKKLRSERQRRAWR